jgi:indole-3-pyruvate monooxygenase
MSATASPITPDDPREVVRSPAVVIGAGPAGLAVGACLRRLGLPFLLLERGNGVGQTWHGHYDRLHLHTPRATSSLPHLRFPADLPRYPSREQVIAYLEAYARHFRLDPLFGQEVCSVRRGPVAAGAATEWEVGTENAVYRTPNVVVATGYSRDPVLPSWPGQERYAGDIVHSSAYRSGRTFAGSRVLVVGFGNSAGEIALDLVEHGARAALSVRGPVNVIPRDVLGIPIVRIGLLFRRFPPRLTDAIGTRLSRLVLGDLGRYGLQRAPYGSMTQIREHARLPLIDIGTMRLIKERRLPVHAAIQRFTKDGVVFTDGTEAAFDAVVLGTGFRAGVDAFLEAPGALDGRGTPLSSGAESPLDGLYFCGFRVAPGGMLREIAAEAPAIARAIHAQTGRYRTGSSGLRRMRTS